MNTFALDPPVISPADPASPTAVLAVDASCSEHALRVRLSDGREVSVPLEWFPRLRDATPDQRANWRLIARGIGIHWEDVDEDIAATTLLRTGWANGYDEAWQPDQSGAPAPDGACASTQTDKAKAS